MATNRKKRIDGLIRKTKRLEEVEVVDGTEVVASQDTAVQKPLDAVAPPMNEVVKDAPPTSPGPAVSSPSKVNRRRG